MTQIELHAPLALLPEGWRSHVNIFVDVDGFIHRVEANATPTDSCQRLDGPVLPGMINVHSHAFQRALAGKTERRGPSDDSFWTWRERMYVFLERLNPDDFEAITRQLYVELLEHGFTSVGEFHYIHHDPRGIHYENPAEMSERVLGAANAVGMSVTLLPVLYTSSGFGGSLPSEAQKRFVHDLDSYNALFEHLRPLCAGQPAVNLGIAPHSLRAVTPDELTKAVSIATNAHSNAPIHLHIAEQAAEVLDCIRWSGQRPVDWLLDHIDVDERWCMIHATHVTDTERERLAGSDAIVGLCPATEANLGDGIFPAEAFLDDGGRFAIGTDSHVSRSVAEELKILEYGQRLLNERRAILANASVPSVGQFLYAHAARHGARALGLKAGAIRTGSRADLVVLDVDRSNLSTCRTDEILDTWVFATTDNPVDAVMVGGQWRVLDGSHVDADSTWNAFRKASSHLFQ